MASTWRPPISVGNIVGRVAEYGEAGRYRRQDKEAGRYPRHDKEAGRYRRQDREGRVLPKVGWGGRAPPNEPSPRSLSHTAHRSESVVDMWQGATEECMPRRSSIKVVWHTGF